MLSFWCSFHKKMQQSLQLKAVFSFSVVRDTGYDLIFMLDGTVNNRVFTWMKNFVRNYASQLPIDSGEYRVGAMTYANTPDGQFQLNQYNLRNEVSNTAPLDVCCWFIWLSGCLNWQKLLCWTLHANCSTKFLFIPTMHIGTIDFYNFIPFSLTLTLPWGHKVSTKQNLLA